MPKKPKNYDKAIAWSRANRNEYINAKAWVEEHDLRLFIEETKVADARSKLNKELSLKIPAFVFSYLVMMNCKFYRTQRKKPMAAGNCLTASEWDDLKLAIAKMYDLLLGLRQAEWVEVLRCRVSCNFVILEGLPTRLKFWKGRT